MNQKDICTIVREAESNYQSGTTQLGEFVSWSLRETIERIIAYINSKHISGDKDSLDREKPFFNIITAAVNIWYRATDLDRKDIIIKPTKNADIWPVFFATAKLQQWMRKQTFGMFLNEWGRTLAKFGSAVVKFVEKDGELIATVIPWNRIITDAVDFDAAPRIEKFYKTPAQLKKMGYFDQKEVDSLIESLTSRKNSNGTNKDNESNFIELYEVHGELPVALLKDEPKDTDWDKYKQQMHIVSFVKTDKGEYDDYTLYKGIEKQDPYMITHLIPEEGRVMSIGAVEYLFDPQWMVNHSMKQMKDTLDLASKLIFQTADTQFLGRNLTSIETGHIFVHALNSPLTQANNTKQDIASSQNFLAAWRGLSAEISSTPDSMRGNPTPANTPYSLVAFQGQQAGSLFEIMTENKGLHLEEMLRRFIIPHIKKSLDTKKEIMAELDDAGIQKLDSAYIPNRAIKNYNKRIVKGVINEDEELPMFDQMAEENAVKQELAPLGNQRPLGPGDVTWKEMFKDIEWEVEVGITNEVKDKQATLTTLSTVLQSIASNPMILQDPNAKMVFNKILSQTGAVSPVELSALSATPPPSPVAQPMQAIA